MIRELKTNPKLDDEFTAEAFIVSGDNRQYMMFVKPTLGRLKAIEVICHELIHLQQYHTMKLVKAGPTLKWKDEIIFDISIIPYLEREWEIEAFVEGEKLERKVKKVLVK